MSLQAAANAIAALKRRIHDVNDTRKVVQIKPVSSLHTRA